MTDKILLQIKSDDQLDSAINNNLNYICAETLASSLEINDSLAGNNGVVVEINGEIQAVIALAKV